MLVALVLTGCCSMAAAQETTRDLAVSSRERAKSFVDEARKISEESREKASEVMDVRKALFESIHGAGAQIVDQALPLNPSNDRKYASQARAHVIFVSFAMPEADLRAAMEVASAADNVHLVFRGVTQKGGVDAFLHRLSALAKGLDPPPPMTIDPPEFKERHISVVPTIVTLEDGKEIARATGTANPDWMNAQIVQARGDLGRWGEVFEPVEVDMEDMLRSAVATIDADAYRRNAEQAFWRSQRRVELPAAMETRVRRVDPSVVVAADIVLPDGKVLVRKGQKVNPLLALPVPFDQRLIVIDGSDHRQRRMAKRWAEEAKGRRVVVMSTRGPSDGEDFESWWMWESEIDQPLTLLSEGIRASLQVSHVPTWIEAEAGELVLHESPVMEKEG